MARTLSQGMTGQDVRGLQNALNFQIRRLAPLRVDSIFGPQTKSRVMEFQRVNKLSADGIFGPLTQPKLFETSGLVLPFQITQNLQLPAPRPGERNIRPPRLIPPLQWPGPPTPLPLPFSSVQPLVLTGGTSIRLPGLSGSSDAVGLKITVPTRNDPEDPFVRSRTAILELIDDLPVNSKFKVLLTKQVPTFQVPGAIQKLSPPAAGFDWDAGPIFDPRDPSSFGVEGKAQFTVRVADGGLGVPKVVFGAWGEGKFTLDWASKNGVSGFTAKAEGQMILGLRGVF